MSTTNSFVLPRILMEHPDFLACTVRERLYLTWVISEFDLHGPFYRSDLEVAVTLATSVSKIRQARRLLAGMGWITIRSGFQSGGRNLASRYRDIPCSRFEPGEPVAVIHRFAFEVLLHRMRRGELRHADVFSYLYLDYLRQREDADADDRFDVSKDGLRELTGLPGVTRSVRRLYRNFGFDEGSHLFTYEDLPERLIFTGWTEFADPSEAEEATKGAEAIQKSIKRQVKARKSELLRQKRTRTGNCRNRGMKDRSG